MDSNSPYLTARFRLKTFILRSRSLRTLIRDNGWLCLPDGAAILLGLYVFYTAFVNPLIPYDSWAYHLPFASFLWNIGDGRNGFIPTYYIQCVYEGFPLFGEWLQGALWKLFDDVRATSLINPIAFALFCLLAGRWLGVRVFWLICGALAFPLFGIHVISMYKDAYVGSLLAIVVLATVRIYGVLLEDKSSIFSPNTRLPWGILCAAAIAVANSKMQAWAILLPFLTFVVITFDNVMQDQKARFYLAVYGAVLVLLCSYNEIANTFRFGNPLFPLMVSLHPFSVHYIYPALGVVASPGFSSTTVTTPDYAGHSLLSQPVYFFFSVTEIDWAIRHIAPHYSGDMYIGTQNVRQMRTGGLWGLYACFHLTLLALLLSAYRKIGPTHRFFLRCFGVMTLIVMLMPRSHELRYVLVWPLLLTVATGIYFVYVSGRVQIVLALMLVLFLGIGQNFLPAERNLFSAGKGPASAKEWRDTGDRKILAKLHDDTATCLEAEETHWNMWFRYAPAIIGGHHTIVAPYDYNKHCDSKALNRWMF